jgi:hypothetical protein
METLSATGTTLEVLAPYLPYNIEVEVTANPGNWYGGRGLLFRLGWPYNEHLHPMSIVSLPKNKAAVVPISHMLPILRPFSALSEPMGDGSIAAVEIAKLVLASQYNFDLYEWEGATVYPFGDGIQVNVTGECDYADVNISPDWTVEHGGGDMGAIPLIAIVNYLRRHHFAVGLEPHQYIAK